MDLGLQGRTAAVAAASTGLGFSCAKALVAEGVRVVICGRARQRIDAAAAALGELAAPVVVDLGTADGGAAFVSAATEALGAGPDILVPNAGGPPRGSIDEVDIDAYRAAIDQNLLSTIAMCETALPAMRERGWGRIVAITSVVVKQPAPYLVLSNTARAGLHGYLKTAAATVAKDGVTVNAVLPGAHTTDRQKALYGDKLEPRGIPVGRFGEPDDFGAVVAFLCSVQAGYISGSSLAVDGGSSGGLF